MAEIESDIKGPVYVYYQLDNFYQNHRRYVKSRDSTQLNGEYVETAKLSNCDPIITVADLWDYQKYNLATPKVKLEDSKPAIPCGLVAKSMFNDTFVLIDKSKTAPNNVITIDQSNIAWSSDITYKFKNIVDKLPEGKTWKDVQW